MRSAMRYMVCLEDGELVKVTGKGFESTGMFLLPAEEALDWAEAVAEATPTAAADA